MLDTLYAMSIDLTFWLQSLGSWLTPVMQFFTFLGNEEFYLFVMPVLVWVLDYNLGVRLGFMLLLSSNLNVLLKMTFRLPRPYWVDPKVGGVASPASGYGLPSGHSQLSISVFGLLAAILKKGWLTIVVIFTVFMVGLSRIYLGEHFFIDVLSGWLVGGLLLWAFVKLEDRVKAWFIKKTNLGKIIAAFLISLALILVAAIIMAIPSNYQVPAEWLANAAAAYPGVEITPFEISNIITPAATLFGLAVGVVWTQADGGFAANQGTWWQKVLRFVVGLIGVAIFWKGLDLVFPDNGDLLGYILRYVRYALVGAWMSGGSIWTFLKLEIGERNKFKKHHHR